VEGLGDVELVAGDSMYIPARTVHSAATTDDVSLHLTIGIIRVSYRDVVDRLLADGPDGLDAPLPIGYRHRSSDGLREHLAAALEATRTHLADVDLDECVRREQQRRGQRPFRVGHIASIAHLHELTHHHRIAWAAAPPLGRVVDRSATGDWRSLSDLAPTAAQRVEISLGGHTITVPAVVLDALRRLETGCPVVIDALPGLDPPSRVVLARRLVEERACVIDAGSDLDHVHAGSSPRRTEPLRDEPSNRPTDRTPTHQGGTPCPTNSHSSESPSSPPMKASSRSS
ncbi:MAG: cupin domain-containing protein, partial [Ilumatobacteraceae bacterium]